MSPAVERLKSEIAMLSDDERAKLADYLRSTLESAEVREVEKAWTEELKRRDAEMSSSQVQGIPGDQVLAELRKRYA
jgi:putative addiction module component (TIGR02574 family)